MLRRSSGSGVSSSSVVNVPAGGITATTVQDAINELDTSKVEANAAIVAGTATKITYDAKGLVTAGAAAAVADITGLQTALDGKVDENVAIVTGTATKITYDAKGLVTAGVAATTADIADSTDRRYCTDAQKTVINNTSGTNTGDQTATMVANTPAGNIVATTVQAAINELDTEKAAATQEAWQDATYTANWSSVNYPTANKAQFMKDSMGFVHIRGLVKSSGGNGVIFTLPAGYRPAREHTFVIHVDSSVWWMVIEPGGAVNTHSGVSCNNACIDGIHFDTR